MPQLPSWIRDFAVLIGRIGLGVVLIAHGWQKFTQWGIAGTTASFQKMGVPAPVLSAWYAAIVELAGGIALVVGIALPLVGVLVALDMLGAFVFVHASHGLLGQGGGELAVVLGVAALAVGFSDGGFSLDRVLFGRKDVRQAELATA